MCVIVAYADHPSFVGVNQFSWRVWWSLPATFILFCRKMREVGGYNHYYLCCCCYLNLVNALRYDMMTIPLRLLTRVTTALIITTSCELIIDYLIRLGDMTDPYLFQRCFVRVCAGLRTSSILSLCCGFLGEGGSGGKGFSRPVESPESVV